jgi:hypothetical protein
MASPSNLQLLRLDGGAPGSAGFRLTGASREGAGLCRIWLRRKEPWSRYLDPRFRSENWDVRCYRRTDSAFALVEDFSVDTLDVLADEFAFDGGDAIDGLRPNGDIVHDTVLGWAKSALGAKADAPGELSVPAEPEPKHQTNTVLPLRASAASRVSPSPEAPVAMPVPSHPVEPTPIEPLDVAELSSALPRDIEVSDAWDEIADLAGRATADATNDE